MPLSVRQGLHSLAFGLSIGCLVLLILLFSFFNERFIAPFVQPSRHVNNIPLITAGAAVGTEPEVIIPKINVEIPVVYDVNTINDAAVDQGLERGVVHYADTALPGQNGNLVIVGHSSNNILNPGKYKFAFVLLSRLENGDTFYIQKDGKRYTYQVYKKTVVSPNDVSVLGPADKVATATLITCDPPGTSINRLVVVGQQISPDPIANTPASTTNTLAKSTKLIPGNSQSLWARIWSSL
jgi:sortase A